MTAPDPDPFVLDTQDAARALASRVELDDALLDVLGRGHDVTTAGPLPGLADLLTTWRRDIDREPLRELITAAYRGHHPAGAQLAATGRNHP